MTRRVIKLKEIKKIIVPVLRRNDVMKAGLEIELEKKWAGK